MIVCPNMLLVAGAGRNVGKTSFICELIGHFSSLQELTGIKISPHHHSMSDENMMIHQSDHFIIREEANAGSGKDSSRMLKAGAKRVYYIEAADIYISDALNEIMPGIETRPVICESAALRKYLIPGIFIFIDSIRAEGTGKNADQKEKANFIVHAYKNSFNFNFGDICYNGKKWRLSNTGK